MERQDALPRLNSFEIGTCVEEGANGAEADTVDQGMEPAAAGARTEQAHADRRSSSEQEGEYGYDVLVCIVRASGLASSDWNGLSDPYARVSISGPEGGSDGTSGSKETPCIQYRTRTVFRSLTPAFDEFFEVANMPAGAKLEAELWDKDLITPDDALGAASWVFEPQQLQSTVGRIPLRLGLRRGKRAGPGELHLEVYYHPSRGPGPMRMLGPVRFRQQLSPLSGLLTGHWSDDRTLAYSTYKVFLCHIEETFVGVERCPWNRRHAAAAHIFRNPLMLRGVRAQHAALYATQSGRCRAGVLGSAEEFFALFSFGQRAGQRRYFTYSLLPDSLRCSETGAQFAVDMMSKHAVHAGAAEEVLYAGEFCILPDEQAPGGHRLVIDNNSGTYAPPKDHLPLMAQLFRANLPRMRVETVAVGSPQLEAYHRQCPSRLKAAAAAEAAAVAASQALQAATLEDGWMGGGSHAAAEAALADAPTSG